ncbi:MAG TPA: hypothetical protein VMJ75_09605 [Candidatus Acidoferrales bacterium]|nr:hypothetical protein [Candidatus Acidoferrales bacterium]
MHDSRRECRISALDVYRFFRDELRTKYMQFIPIVERTTADFLPLANLGWGERPGSDRPLYTQNGTLVTDRSVGAEQFGRFLIAIFDEWVHRDVGGAFVADLRRRSCQLARAAQSMHLLAHLRQRDGAGAQR